MPVTAATDVALDDPLILATVMEEIVQIIHARGATLTLHDGGAYPATTLYHSPTIAVNEQEPLLQACSKAEGNLHDQRLAWRTVAGVGDVAIIPVERVPGHSRLLITIVFDQIDPETRDHAERIYRERRPFAVGFFRFWQLSRLHMRRYRALQTALDCTDLGVLLVDRSAHILFANQAADDLLAAGDGLGKHNGMLRAASLRDGVNLSAALSYISGRDGADARVRAPLLAFKRKDRPSLMATVIPARGGAIEARDVAATIYLVDPQLNLVKNLEPICQLYGLSPVETKLVCHLAAGDPIADASAKMRIKEQTARTYLKHIFIKTDTNRQTALVSLMLSSLMRMKSDVVPEALTDLGAEQALAHCA